MFFSDEWSDCEEEEGERTEDADEEDGSDDDEENTGEKKRKRKRNTSLWPEPARKLEGTALFTQNLQRRLVECQDDCAMLFRHVTEQSDQWEDDQSDCEELDQKGNGEEEVVARGHKTAPWFLELVSCLAPITSLAEKRRKAMARAQQSAGQAANLNRGGKNKRSSSNRQGQQQQQQLSHQNNNSNHGRQSFNTQQRQQQQPPKAHNTNVHNSKNNRASSSVASSSASSSSSFVAPSTSSKRPASYAAIASVSSPLGSRPPSPSSQFSSVRSTPLTSPQSSASGSPLGFPDRSSSFFRSIEQRVDSTSQSMVDISVDMPSLPLPRKGHGFPPYRQAQWQQHKQQNQHKPGQYRNKPFAGKNHRPGKRERDAMKGSNVENGAVGVKKQKQHKQHQQKIASLQVRKQKQNQKQGGKKPIA